MTEKLQGFCLLLKMNPYTEASPTDATHKKSGDAGSVRGDRTAGVEAPVYLPQEFTTIDIVAVYIPPNNKQITRWLFHHRWLL